MTPFGQLLREKREAIVQRWLEAALSTYDGRSAAAFRRRNDPFANPVGHSLRVGTREIFEALSDGKDAAGIGRHLHEIIRIRAVQELPASQTVGFVFELKEAVRAELGLSAGDTRFAAELAELDRQIDRMALAAFDVFVQCRERISELRVNEVKRQVSWIAGKIGRRCAEPRPAPASDAAEGRRECVR